MQPLPTSSHSSTCSSPLLTVRDFSMSSAVAGVSYRAARTGGAVPAKLTVAKLIHDDGNLLAMLGRQNVVEQGGLAGAQVAWLGACGVSGFPVPWEEGQGGDGGAPVTMVMGTLICLPGSTPPSSGEVSTSSGGMSESGSMVVNKTGFAQNNTLLVCIVCRAVISAQVYENAELHTRCTQRYAVRSTRFCDATGHDLVPRPSGTRSDPKNGLRRVPVIYGGYLTSTCPPAPVGLPTYWDSTYLTVQPLERARARTRMRRKPSK